MNPDSPPSPDTRRRLWLWIAVILLGATAGIVAGHFLLRPSVPDSVQRAGAKLLRLTLPDADGQPVRFAQWSGKPLVVNFWATWCPPCREEMPLLDRAAGEHPDVQFVGISVDRADAVRAYTQAHHPRYPLPVTGLDLAPLAGELGNSAMALPFSVFIDAAGKVRHTKLGALKETELQAFLTELDTAPYGRKSAK